MEISLLPIDLVRWDQAPGGDLLAVGVWSDVRPLRGTAGLVDWRLNGKLSWCLRNGRLSGAGDDKLLLPTRRLPWRAVLAVGMGQSTEFSEDRYQGVLRAIFATMRGLGFRTLAATLPGRDTGRIEPERALALLLALVDDEGPVDLTIIDIPTALKTMGERAGLTRTPRPRRTMQVAGNG